MFISIRLVILVVSFSLIITFKTLLLNVKIHHYVILVFKTFHWISRFCYRVRWSCSTRDL